MSCPFRVSQFNLKEFPIALVDTQGIVNSIRVGLFSVMVV